MYSDVLSVLSTEPGTPSGELAIQKNRFEGLALGSLHKFTKAERDFDEADRICATSAYPACADVITARGALEMERGNFARAQSLFERVLGLARTSGDRLWEAEILLDLSWSADEQTHFDEALDWADAAHQIAVAQGVADVAQTAMGNIGWAYYKLGDLDKALQVFVEADKNAKALGDLTNQTKWVTNAGYVYMDQGDFNAAERSFTDSLVLARRNDSRANIIDALIALAFVSEQTQKVDDARRYADEALRMATEDGNKVDQAYPKLVQGRIAAQQHDAVAAQSALEEVVDSKDSPVFLKWEAQRSLARLYEDEHQNEGASREYRAALSTFESARSELKHENTRLPFLTNATHIYDDYIHFLVSQGKSDEALQVAEYSRARTLSEGLGLLKNSTEYRVASTEKKAKASSQPGSASPEKKPKIHGTRYSVLGTFHPDSVNASQIARRAGGSIFFYWLGEKQSYLWLVTAQKTTLFPLPPAAEIDTAVRRYRNALQGSQDPLEISNGDGFTLYRTLIGPAQELLAKENAKPCPATLRAKTRDPQGLKPASSLHSNGTAVSRALPESNASGGHAASNALPKSNASTGQLKSNASGASLKHVCAGGSRVFIIPDGSLNTLNFETLIVSDSTAPDPTPHYWIEDVTLADASSLRLLAASRPAVAHSRPLLIMGDAVSPSADYPQLQKASDEIASIGKHFVSAQQTVFTRDQATPTAYLSSKPEQFSYIHFVAHGTASRTNPLDSAIVLSRATKEDDSFKLYARDIIHHNLHADLVTISTCYGAGFRAYSGEGLVGLSWAFLRAGAHNVIGALWEVSDVSTPQLMDRLYGDLKNGQKPDAALRAAKLSMLHSNTPFRKPFYWAPFQLYTGS